MIDGFVYYSKYLIILYRYFAPNLCPTYSLIEDTPIFYQTILLFALLIENLQYWLPLKDPMSQVDVLKLSKQSSRLDSVKRFHFFLRDIVAPLTHPMKFLGC